MSEQTSFLWGAATSSHQVEGYNDKNDWWAWEAEGHIEGGVRSGPATDHWNRFREDLRLAKDLGLNSYRFSVEWSRCEPEQGRWDASAFEWYRELISECLRLGLAPMLTLHHFTSPLWFARQGGFPSVASPDLFARYTREVVERIGAPVKLWCTFNEPMVLVAGSYLGKFMPPAVFSPRDAAAASANLLRAHVKSYLTVRGLLAGNVQVGIAHNMLDFMPERPWHPMENLLARVFRRFYNQSWLSAVTGRRQHFGVPGLIPYPEQVEEARGKVTADFIGVNYYTKAYVQWRPRDAAEANIAEIPVGLSFAGRTEKASDVGWAIHPKGFRRILKEAASYGLPVYVTENGIADKDDALREEYIRSHLRELTDLRKSGMDIRGYYHWSLLDNFEWIKGFGPRFGLYKVDYETFERTPRASGATLKRIISGLS